MLYIPKEQIAVKDIKAARLFFKEIFGLTTDEITDLIFV
jgi:predicted enzyme related to lactoylglutathione lyase